MVSTWPHLKYVGGGALDFRMIGLLPNNSWQRTRSKVYAAEK